MTVDKNSTSILEQVERFPQGLTEDDIKQIRDSVRLSLFADNLADEKAETEKVCTNSEIREDRSFLKQDVAKLIMLFAIANKLDLENLKVTRIIKNEQGTLLVLEVKFPNPDGGYKLINYTIKGRHERMHSRTTNLDMASWDNDGDLPDYAEIIAEYQDGKWRFIFE